MSDRRQAYSSISWRSSASFCRVHRLELSFVSFLSGRIYGRQWAMSFATEVYNRVVQCQANQRCDRRGRRRRHLSDQSIKTETPSQN